MAKFSVIVALALVATTTAYSSFMGSRKTLRSGRAAAGKSSLVMEDFGFLKGTGLAFDDVWGGNPFTSEERTEQELNKIGLRYKMNRTEKEAEGLGVSFGPLSIPGVASIWEALGFTATSNNEARQQAKMEASAKVSVDKEGKRTKYLAKYGYPRLVGTGGIFYADQLSTDKKPMGGFGMGKSGVIWGVPKVVEDGTYGGSAGWGGKMAKNAKK